MHAKTQPPPATEAIPVRSKIINRRDLTFVLYELLKVESLTTRPRYADHSRETFEAALDTAQQIAEEHFAPHNRKADLNEPTFDGKRVHMIPEVSTALKVFCEAGLMAAAQDYDLGGMQLPVTVAQALFSLFKSANVGTAAYPFLTIGNANLIRTYGTAQQKAKYLPHLFSGRFFGTMCLSEPQAGSSLADIRTTAYPQDDGTYRIVGNKMWISGGEHDLSDNIIHLVLAKAKGAPPGVKGISLFIVPKYLVNDDGSLGERNDVVLAGLNHKMGYRGTTNCALNFGETYDAKRGAGGAIGELVGEPNLGLTYMFHMMNEARIGVGMGAVMLGYTGYLHSLDYARNRPQGRLPAGKDPLSAQVPIVRHSDVKRMLLAQKAYVEGGFALCLYAARLVDEQKTGETEAARHEAGLLLDILTPIVKAWPSEWCLHANYLAIQIHGGYGYTRDYQPEQFYRDNRLNPIHEGTNGIQSLDLLGRKAAMQGGRALKLLAAKMLHTAAEAQQSASADLRTWGEQLAGSVRAAGETTAVLLGKAGAGEVDLALANSAVYLDMMGHIVVAWIWLQQALLASAVMDRASSEDEAFYRGKLAACRYFFHWELPKTQAQKRLLDSLDTTCLDMQDAWF
jgi:alkylation response protein AidB-like acyl-CoA dehydrogenase